MDEPRFQVVARAADIAQGKCLRVGTGGRDILICHTAEGFYALENRCSHAQSRLDGGRMRSHRLFCPLHGAAFDVRDGSALSRPAVRSLKSYPLRLDGEEILVAIGD